MILVPFEPEVRDRICRSLCANFGFGALVAFVVLRSSRTARASAAVASGASVIPRLWAQD
jgi:hypothetical protein